MIARAQGLLTTTAVADRCTRMAGDFFHTVPGGGDAYLLKRVLHDWLDAQARAILRQCRRVMATHGRLLVIERVLPTGNTPSLGKLADIAMLIQYEGWSARRPSIAGCWRRRDSGCGVSLRRRLH